MGFVGTVPQDNAKDDLVFDVVSPPVIAAWVFLQISDASSHEISLKNKSALKSVFTGFLSFRMYRWKTFSPRFDNFLTIPFSHLLAESGIVVAGSANRRPRGLRWYWKCTGLMEVMYPKVKESAMARKNRVSVPNGTYHITSRIVNREKWFEDPKLKDDIVKWMYGIAAFSGVELLTWCIMDNHFHLLVHIPEVPERYHLDPSSEPASYAFGMRPPECNPPIWSPCLVRGDSPHETSLVRGDSPHVMPVSGDSPLKAGSFTVGGDSPRSSRGDSPHVMSNTVRPATDFMLSDGEMLERLLFLYGDAKRIRAIARNWADMRACGNGAAVDAIKERYCRRMYNLSQFTKTFKERISQVINKRLDHVGHVFEGRFYSGLIQGDISVTELVSLYIDYNPYKAGMTKDGEYYRWSSFGQANGAGEYCAECRKAYERMFGCSWLQVRKTIMAAFREKMPKGDDVMGKILDGQLKLKISQLIKLKVTALTRGPFIGRSMDFADDITKAVSKGFPRAGMKSLKFLVNAVDWPIRRFSAA